MSENLPVDMKITPTTLEQLRSVDPDRLRAAALAEPQIRDDLTTLYAFHYELAKIPELVSEPMMGAIRYQWWRDCVDEIYTGNKVRRHEIATPLSELLRGSMITRFDIDSLIDARQRDLDPRPFESLDEARQYARETSGQLAALAANICGCGADLEPARALGTVWGLAGLVRAYPFYTQGMLSKLEFDTLKATTLAAYADVPKKLGSKILPATAYIGLVPGYLKRADPTEEATKPYPPLRKQGRIFWTTLRGKLP